MSVTKQFRDKDQIVKNIGKNADGKDAQAWYYKNGNIRVNKASTTFVNGSTTVQTYLVKYPGFTISGIPNSMSSGYPSVSFDDSLPNIGEALKVLKGLQFKNILLYTYCNSGSAFTGGTLTLTINGFEVYKTTALNGPSAKKTFPTGTDFNTDTITSNVDAALSSDSGAGIFDFASVVNGDTASTFSVSLSGVNTNPTGDTNIYFEFGIVLPMSFSIKEGTGQIDGKSKLDIGAFDDMRDSINDALDGNIDQLDTLSISLYDFKNDLLTGTFIAVATDPNWDSTKATNLTDWVVRPLAAGSSIDLDIAAGKKMPAIVLLVGNAGFAIPPGNTTGSDFDFKGLVQASASLNARISF
jgi:hypothetical protein